jgi:hypothetical protein
MHTIGPLMAKLTDLVSCVAWRRPEMRAGRSNGPCVGRGGRPYSRYIRQGARYPLFEWATSAFGGPISISFPSSLMAKSMI